MKLRQRLPEGSWNSKFWKYNSPDMAGIEPNYAVKIKFSMKSHLLDGTVKERPDEITEFLYNVQPQVPTLEKALEGARVGDKFNLRVPPAEIYGEYNDALIKEIPKQGFIKQRIRKGKYYRQMREGCLVSFKILEIREKTVLADFNGPMAGIWVEMAVEVLDVRKASAEEIEAAREKQAKKNIGCG